MVNFAQGTEGPRRIQKTEESAENTKKTSSADFRFLYSLPAKVPFVIEKPNQKRNRKHGQNQPCLACGEVRQDGCGSHDSQHVAEGIKSSVPMKAPTPGHTSLPDVNYSFHLAPF
jgi:hypothetical protein